MVDCDSYFHDMMDVELILRVAANDLECRDDLFDADRSLLLNHLGISKRCSLNLLRSFNQGAETVSMRLKSQYLRSLKEGSGVDEIFDETLQNTHISMPEPLSALHWVTLLTNMVWVELGLPSTPVYEWKVLDLVRWARLCEYPFNKLDAVVDHPQCEIFLRSIVKQLYSPRLLHPLLIFEQLFILCQKSAYWSFSTIPQPSYPTSKARHRTPDKRVSNRFEYQRRPGGIAGAAPPHNSRPNISEIPLENSEELYIQSQRRKQETPALYAPQSSSPTKGTSRSARLLQDERERENRALEQRQKTNKPFSSFPPSSSPVGVSSPKGPNAWSNSVGSTSGDRLPPNSGQTTDICLSTAVSFPPPNSIWESDQTDVLKNVNTIPRLEEAFMTFDATEPLNKRVSPPNSFACLQRPHDPKFHNNPRFIDEGEDLTSGDSDEDYEMHESQSSDCEDVDISQATSVTLEDVDISQATSVTLDQSWSEMEAREPHPTLSLNVHSISPLGTIRAEGAVSSELLALQDSQPSQELQEDNQNSNDSFGLSRGSPPACNTITTIHSNSPPNNVPTASRMQVEISSGSATSTRRQNRNRELVEEYEGPSEGSKPQGKRMKLKSPEREDVDGAPLRHEFSDGGPLFPTDDMTAKSFDGSGVSNVGSNKKRQNQAWTSNAWHNGQFAYPHSND